MTPVKISIAAAIASLLLILIVLELIRGRRLKERYALLWLVTGRRAARPLGLARRAATRSPAGSGVATYPPAILFAVATLFIIIVLLHYSTVLSQLDDQNTVLAQRLALLEDGARAARCAGHGQRPSPPAPDDRPTERGAGYVGRTSSRRRSARKRRRRRGGRRRADQRWQRARGRSRCWRTSRRRRARRLPTRRRSSRTSDQEKSRPLDRSRAARPARLRRRRRRRTASSRSSRGRGRGA